MPLLSYMLIAVKTANCQLMNGMRKIMLCVLLLMMSTASAIDRTQSIELKKGWNAVHVQVDSGEQSLNEVFGGTPIDLVATYYHQFSSAEFIKDPSEEPWQDASWHKWIAPDRPDAFLSNLYRLNAGRGYLVHATEDHEWSLTGSVRLYKHRWQPSAFTLTGLPVTAVPPAVSQLMDISGVHREQPIYTLETKEGVSRWVKVEDRVSIGIEQNKAYWIYTNGGSEHFTGAIDVKLSDTHTARELDFLNIVNVKKITLRNASDSERSVSLTLVNNDVPLMMRERDSETKLSTYRSVTGSLFDEPLVIPAGEETEIVLQVDRKAIADNTQVEGLLKITDDVGGYNAGGEYWVPIKATSGEIR